MNRRSFLGSVIGAIPIPFLALTDSKPWQEVLLPYRMMMRVNGIWIQSPGVRTLTEETTQEGKRYVFRATDLEAKVPMSIDAVRLSTEKGKTLSEIKYSEVYNLISGDTLKTTISLGGGFNKMPLEEVLELYAKYGNRI